MKPGRVGTLGVPAALALMVWAASCGPPDETAPRASLLLVSIDTLRSDRLPVYGYDAGETPHIDRFAADALIFERVYSQVPLTLPSHASIFTGKLPPHHGVRDNLGFRLADEQVTLAERLSAAGYRTRGTVSSMVLRSATGISQGFDVYDDDMPKRSRLRRTFAERDGSIAVETAERWLDELAAEPSHAPFFLFVHLFEPHTPYAAPEPHAGRHEHPYDAEIGFADSLFGRLLDALERSGLDDDAVVVLLSDHGEGLGDHVEREHGLTLYREALQVPLLIRLPGGRGGARRVVRPAALVDVAPTLLRLLGIAADGMDGEALLAGDGSAAARPIYAETVFTRLQYGWSELRSIVLEDLHYIESPRPELFDLRQDPAERRSLLPGAEVPPAALWTLKDLGTGDSTEVEVDEETRRQLGSLGYVGSLAAAPAAGGLPDPKDHIADVEALWALIRRTGAAPGDARVRELLATVAGNESLHRAAARSLLAHGRTRLAAELLAPFGDTRDVDTLVVLGQVASAAGRADRARELFERAVALEPEHPEAQLGIGTVLLGDGRLGEAIARLERAIELDPEVAEAWNGLGAARVGRGDVAGGVAAWREATRLDPDYADAWFNLALASREVGDRSGAADALRNYARLVSGAERERALSMLRSLETGS